MKRKYLKRSKRLLKDVYNPFGIKQIILEVPRKDSAGVSKVIPMKTWSLYHKQSKKNLAYGKFSELLPFITPLGNKGTNIF